MILVTGGTGLLGSHLLLELMKRKQEVVAVRRASSDLEEVRRVFAYYSEESEELFDLIEWVEADLMDYAAVEELTMKVKRVYHCAAQVSFQPRDAKLMIEHNTGVAANVVNACLSTGIEKLLHVSSSSAIGKAPEGMAADENLIWATSKQHSSYSVSKFRSEMEVWRGVEEGLNAVIVNPVIILGPGFWSKGSSSIFERVAGGLKFGTPGMTGYVGVEDVVTAMTRLMNSDISGERFILSAGDYSYAELFELVAEALGQARKIKTVSPALLSWLERLDAFRGIFTGSRTLTPEQVRSAFNVSRYNSDKVREAIGLDFTPIREVVNRVAAFYDAPRRSNK